MAKRIIKNDFLTIEYLTTALSIASLIPVGKQNMLAELSNFPAIPTPYGDFQFHGGHRLWHSPEAMPRTYVPDKGALTITDLSNGVILESQTEQGTGIRKLIEIHLAPNQPSITLKHTLINDGLWPVELAPWAITQFRLGGTVILPMPSGNVDPAGLLPNRQISLWPYARINDTRLKLDDNLTLFKADAILPPFKIGYFNSHGWMAYWLDGILFRKTFEAQSSVSYPDNNCNAEMYCNNQFLELESLAPLTKLNPNASVTHLETWEIFTELNSIPVEIKQVIIDS